MRDGADHDQAYDFHDWWHEREERAGIREEYSETNGNGATAPSRFRLSPKRTRAEMHANTVRFLCPAARFLARGVSSLVTSLGGVGKTRMFLQMFYQLERGEALFGCEWLRPERPMHCLYIGAEDREAFFNYVALPLLAHAGDDAILPFDYCLLPDIWPGFTLNRETAPQLACFIDELSTDTPYDCIGLDPMLSLIGMEYVDMIKNPIVSRAFFNDCLAPLLASQAFALISGNHDSKTGAAVTGSADQQNAARCVLQLSTEPTDTGTTEIEVERHKDNLGFRFTKLVLERDPETLLLTWNEAASIYAYGAPAGHATAARPSKDPADLMRYLCRQAARHLAPHPLSEDVRTKRVLEGRLMHQAKADGYANIRTAVRDCLATYCRFQESREGTKKLILCGVRNPDAALDDADDYLAGGPPEESA